ncbi:MAG: hypothetical protein HC888_13000 [Candidatus Competibacteraceae bacterium]|nr:hypothetical protein [Candidatus Competibacteraceae bacterium]
MKRKTPEHTTLKLDDRLRKSARIYLEHAIGAYLAIEGKLTFFSDANIGQSAAVIGSIHRAMEHLMKLALLKKDPVSLFPLQKVYEKYAELRGLFPKGKKRPSLPNSGTIDFREAIERIQIIYGDGRFDSKVFSEIHTLRNSIEHFWDHNLAFLEKNISLMSSKVIPAMDDFVKNVLREDPIEYVSKRLRHDVNTLDRAISEGNSLILQKRLEEFQDAYGLSPRKSMQLSNPSSQHLKLDSIETDASCPICSTNMTAYWDFEADYDEYGPVAAYPDAKLLLCENCGFYAEGMDIEHYLPESLDEYMN